MRFAPPLAAFAAMAFALPAVALEAPRDYAGSWTLAGVSEGAEACAVKLGDERAIGGWTIDVPADCVDKLGVSPDIAAWTVHSDGAIGFIDPLRRTLLKFEPTDVGGYVAQPDEGEPLSLDRVEPNLHEPTEQERMAGRWALMSMGERLCGWTSMPSADGMRGGLEPSGACQPQYRKIVRWQRAKGRLMLMDQRGRLVMSLPGDSIEGFFSPADVDNLGFVRDRD